MFMAQPVIHGPCDTCKDTGNHPTKRKTPCPDCGGSGSRHFCTRCHGLTSEHKQIVGGWLCEAEPLLSGRTSTGKALSMTMLVGEDGNRSAVRMIDLCAGDEFQIFGNQHIDPKQTYIAKGNAYLNEDGIATVMTEERA